MKVNITHLGPMSYNPWLFFQMAAGTFTFEHMFADQGTHQLHDQ